MWSRACSWRWKNPQETEDALNSLAKRGLVKKYETTSGSLGVIPHYWITAEGRAVVAENDSQVGQAA